MANKFLKCARWILHDEKNIDPVFDSSIRGMRRFRIRSSTYNTFMVGRYVGELLERRGFGHQDPYESDDPPVIRRESEVGKLVQTMKAQFKRSALVSIQNILQDLIANFGNRKLVDKTGHIPHIDHKDAATLQEIVKEAERIFKIPGFMIAAHEVANESKKSAQEIIKELKESALDSTLIDFTEDDIKDI